MRKDDKTKSSQVGKYIDMPISPALCKSLSGPKIRNLDTTRFYEALRISVTVSLTIIGSSLSLMVICLYVWD